MRVSRPSPPPASEAQEPLCATDARSTASPPPQYAADSLVGVYGERARTRSLSYDDAVLLYTSRSAPSAAHVDAAPLELPDPHVPSDLPATGDGPRIVYERPTSAVAAVRRPPLRATIARYAAHLKLGRYPPNMTRGMAISMRAAFEAYQDPRNDVQSVGRLLSVRTDWAKRLVNCELLLRDACAQRGLAPPALPAFSATARGNRREAAEG